MNQTTIVGSSPNISGRCIFADIQLTISRHRMGSVRSIRSIPFDLSSLFDFKYPRCLGVLGRLGSPVARVGAAVTHALLPHALLPHAAAPRFPVQYVIPPHVGMQEMQDMHPVACTLTNFFMLDRQAWLSM